MGVGLSFQHLGQGIKFRSLGLVQASPPAELPQWPYFHQWEAYNSVGINVLLHIKNAPHLVWFSDLSSSEWKSGDSGNPGPCYMAVVPKMGTREFLEILGQNTSPRSKFLCGRMSLQKMFVVFLPSLLC